MADLIAYLGNCLISGIAFTTDNDGIHTRNLVPLTINKRQFELIQDPSFIQNRPQIPNGEFVEVTKLRTRNVTQTEVNAILEDILYLTELLSFGTESRVVLCGYDYPTEGTIAQRRSVIGTVQGFRPPFNIFDGTAFKQFIESSFDAYVSLRTTRSLHIVIDFLHHASMNGIAEEIRLINLFVLLENLKHSYAHSVGYPYIKGYFREIGATASNPGGKKTFETLLTSMLAAVSMSATISPLVGLRNQLIHSGLLNLNMEQKFELYCQIQDIVREYLLRLLAYKGIYQSSFMTMKTIT